eukprot:1098309-Rhodomonas_salina.1
MPCPWAWFSAVWYEESRDAQSTTTSSNVAPASAISRPWSQRRGRKRGRFVGKRRGQWESGGDGTTREDKEDLQGLEELRERGGQPGSVVADREDHTEAKHRRVGRRGEGAEGAGARGVLEALAHQVAVARGGAHCLVHAKEEAQLREARGGRE